MTMSRKKELVGNPQMGKQASSKGKLRSHYGKTQPLIFVHPGLQLHYTDIKVV